MTEILPTENVADNELLKLDNQLCFPLYAASRLITRLYQPILEPLGLTYPQYIVLMILWQDAPCPISHISDRALLNTNTLTPLLKRLESLGFILRTRRASDERIVDISLTDEGYQLKSLCGCVPQAIQQQTHMPIENIIALKTLLDELLIDLKTPRNTKGQKTKGD